MGKDKDTDARMRELQKQIDDLKRAMGIFANGLDRNSQIQASQSEVMERLVEGNENHTKALRKLMNKIDESHRLLRALSSGKGGKE